APCLAPISERLPYGKQKKVWEEAWRSFQLKRRAHPSGLTSIRHKSGEAQLLLRRRSFCSPLPCARTLRPSPLATNCIMWHCGASHCIAQLAKPLPLRHSIH
ncbi:hypothetical protein Tcan_00817, partial [Toxocara canis]